MLNVNRNASPNQLVQTIFEKIRVIKVEMSYLREKSTLILGGPFRRHSLSHQIIDYVRIPGSSINHKQLLIWETIIKRKADF
ncbi:hypothetical protein I3843_04G145800 [Carya illinoinensis]|nr:hypothetical protein I3843_04G145800 [Carya illinoinensis]